MACQHDERLTAIHLLRAGHSTTAVAEQLGRSPRWVRKWRQRYEQAGWAGLQERSRAPRQHGRRFSPAVSQLVIQARSELEAEAALGQGLKYIGGRAVRTKLRGRLPTALPSVRFYDTGDAASVTRLLADGFQRRDPSQPAIIYAAENHNHAAEILSERLTALVRPEALTNSQTLNTVIGKMSGVITDADTIRGLDLAPLTPGTPRAVLVERFNHILISRVTLEGFQRGIEVFVEKADLLPFEEAKLYGHNAIHALIGYLAHLRGLTTMAEAAAHGDIMATARAAFLDESGAALVKKYEHLRDPLFTADGYRVYADDLIERMVNPHLNDLIARVTRDARRKLGYDDRLFGTMRLALSQGIEPIHMAQGAAAALLCASEGRPQTKESVGATLREIWDEQADEQADHLIALTWEAMPSS